MFSTTIRLQARPVLVAQKLARTATVSASQSFSRLALRSALSQQASPLLRGVAGISSRSFSQSAPVNLGHSIQPNVPSRVLFVGNIPWSSTKEELQELFREFGDILSVRIHTHADGRPRGFGHIEFTSKEHAIACFTSAMEEPIYFAGRDLVIDYAKDYSPQTQDIEPNNRLYFVGCSDGEEVLKNVFSSFTDNIISIYFLRDGNTGMRLSRGFVEFKSVGTATEALTTLNGASLPNGENLTLSFARPPKRRDQNAQNPRLANNRRDKYTRRSWSRSD